MQATKPIATIETSKGNIKLELYPAEAPNTVANFIEKANSGAYVGRTFHRVESWVIQGGDPAGSGMGGGQMTAEYNNLPFSAGALGIARSGNKAINNADQFFITKSDASWLNGEYTNFGQVIEGMEVVNAIRIGDKINRIVIEGGAA